MDIIKIINTPIPLRAGIYGAISFILTGILLSLACLGFNYYTVMRTNYPMSGIIVLDLGHKGLQLTALDKKQTKTFFDFDKEDFVSQTAWLGQGSGFLVTEEGSQSKNKKSSIRFFGNSQIDGFYALAAFDSNLDDQVDETDARWAELRVWMDENKDAAFKNTELHTLGDLGIENISLTTERPDQPYVAGNEIKKKANFTYYDQTYGSIYSIILTRDKINSHFQGDYTLHVETLFLPTLRGFGRLPDLHVAMSMNETLRDLVKKEAQKDIASYFSDPRKTQDDIERILFTWAQVSDIPSDSRGPNIDAKKLGFLEKLLAEDFRQTGAGGTPNPLPAAASSLLESWRRAYHPLKASILIQTGGKALFDGPISYNPWTGTMQGTGTLSEKGLADLVAYASATGVDTNAFWTEAADFLQYTKGLKNLTLQEISWLDADVKKSNASLSWEEISSARVNEDTQPNSTAQIEKSSVSKISDRSRVLNNEYLGPSADGAMAKDNKQYILWINTRQNLTLAKYLNKLEGAFKGASGGKDYIDESVLFDKQNDALKEEKKRRLTRILRYDDNFDENVTSDEIRAILLKRELNSEDSERRIKIESRINDMMSADQNKDDILSHEEMIFVDDEAQKNIKARVLRSMKGYFDIDPSEDKKLTLEELKVVAEEFFILVDQDKDGLLSKDELSVKNKVLDKPSEPARE